MKSIMFIEKGKTAIIEESKPVCKDDTILLKTIYSGMTNGTERNLLMGGNYGGIWPIQRTYQLVSEVIECGRSISRYRKGDIVFSGVVLGHVEYHLAKESDLIIKIPEEFDLVAAALLGIASVPLHDVRRADVKVNDNVLVYGGGLVGQFAAQAANVHGARVTLVDIDDNRLELAKQLGTDNCINTSTNEGKERLQTIKPFSVVIECTGANVMDKIVGTEWGGGSGLVGHRARIVMVAGRYDVTYSFNAAQCDEISVLHASHFDQSDLEEMVRLVSSEKIKIRPLIKDMVRIESAVEVYNTLRDSPNKLLGTVFDWR